MKKFISREVLVLDDDNAREDANGIKASEKESTDEIRTTPIATKTLANCIFYFVFTTLIFYK